MVAAAGRTLDVRVEVQDCCRASNGRTVSVRGHAYTNAHFHLRGGEQERRLERGSTLGHEPGYHSSQTLNLS